MTTENAQDSAAGMSVDGAEPGGPIGIADLNRAYVQVKYQDLPDHWYWCRLHEQATSFAGRECSTADSRCVLVGPFMSEREANRLAECRDCEGWIPLGLRVER